MKAIIKNCLISLIVVALSLCSCAHKTGHGNKDMKSGSSRTPIEKVGGGKTVENKKTSTKESAAGKGSNRRKLEGTEIFNRYNTAVFMIFTSNGLQGYQGSGFFIDNEGLAVSNYHVFMGTIKGEEYIKLQDDDTDYKVKEVIYNSKDETFNNEDFIIFRVDCKNTNYIPIANSKPQVGETVYAIGSPLGYENTFSSGGVSQYRDDKHNLIQISVPIDHGSSGGALINEYGEVVGITSAGRDDSQANLNFAWSIDVIKPYIK